MLLIRKLHKITNSEFPLFNDGVGLPPLRIPLLPHKIIADVVCVYICFFILTFYLMYLKITLSGLTHKRFFLLEKNDNIPKI